MREEGYVTELLAGSSVSAPSEEAAGHRRLLAVLELCCDEMARLSRYHRALLRAFMSVSETAGLQATLAAALSAEITRSLEEMKERRRLEEWVVPAVLAQRITASCVGASASWALGELDDRGLRAAMLHAGASMVLGAARGVAHRELLATVQRAQAELEQHAPRARRPRPRRLRASTG